MTTSKERRRLLGSLLPSDEELDEHEGDLPSPALERRLTGLFKKARHRARTGKPPADGMSTLVEQFRDQRIALGEFCSEIVDSGVVAKIDDSKLLPGLPSHESLADVMDALDLELPAVEPHVLRFRTPAAPCDQASPMMAFDPDDGEVADKDERHLYLLRLERALEAIGREDLLVSE
jgi:hypothetical protein